MKKLVFAMLLLTVCCCGCRIEEKALRGQIGNSTPLIVTDGNDVFYVTSTVTPYQTTFSKLDNSLSEIEVVTLPGYRVYDVISGINGEMIVAANVSGSLSSMDFVAAVDVTVDPVSVIWEVPVHSGNSNPISISALAINDAGQVFFGVSRYDDDYRQPEFLVGALDPFGVLWENFLSNAHVVTKIVSDGDDAYFFTNFMASPGMQGPIRKIDPNGSILWEQSLSGHFGDVTLAKNLVVVSSGLHEVWVKAFFQDSGIMAWEYNIVTLSMPVATNIAPIASDVFENLYISYFDFNTKKEKVVVLDCEGGFLIDWEQIGGVTNEPKSAIYNKGRVYVAGVNMLVPHNYEGFIQSFGWTSR